MIASQRNFGARMQRSQIESEMQINQKCETKKENLQSLGDKISHNINNSEMRQLLRVRNTYIGI